MTETRAHQMAHQIASQYKQASQAGRTTLASRIARTYQTHIDQYLGGHDPLT